MPVGTSVGQIRLNDAVKTNDLIYDLLHGYEEGGTYICTCDSDDAGRGSLINPRRSWELKAAHVAAS